MPQPKDCQEWSQREWQSVVQVQSMRNTRCSQPETRLSGEQKEQIIAAYYECSCMRGIQRTFGVSRPKLISWLKKDEASPKLEETLLPVEPEDVLEVDEMWSFIYEKWNKRWLWTVMCQRTRQIIAFVIGDRSEATCRKLWELIPPAYHGCQSYTDFWEADQLVFPEEAHKWSAKAAGRQITCNVGITL